MPHTIICKFHKMSIMGHPIYMASYLGANSNATIFGSILAFLKGLTQFSRVVEKYTPLNLKNMVRIFSFKPILKGWFRRNLQIS